MANTALICGISGQDGSYLAQLLLSRGLTVWGTSRDAEISQFSNLRRLGIFESVKLASLNLRDVASITNLLRQIQPDQIYSLAGQSSVGLSFAQPVETMESIALGTLNLLEGIRLASPDSRFYNAGSSETFGDTGDRRATEESPMRPRSPYATAKAAAFWTVANYRESYKIFACTGILSNHDSPLRPARFVTRKIIRAVASISLGKEERLTLGNLEIQRDWGWAPDYVRAMVMMSEAGVPDDYLIATGTSYTLVEFVEKAFNLVGRDWRDYVAVDKQLLRPSDIASTRLNPAKAASKLGWTAQFAMPEIVSMMLDAEIATIRCKQPG